ncbi:MAG: hypothetical protein ABR501_06030 [Pyrinomonadaceae bacterium]
MHPQFYADYAGYKTNAEEALVRFFVRPGNSLGGFTAQPPAASFFESV